MKIPTAVLGAALVLSAAGPLSAAGSYELKMTAVNGNLSHFHSQLNEAGKRNDFAGKSAAEGEEPRGLVFNSLLKEGKKGTLLLDYVFELAGGKGNAPRMRAAAKVALAPGKKILAAVSGPWKYYLEITGSPPKRGDTGNHQLVAEFFCVKSTAAADRAGFPVRVSAFKGEQAEVTAASQEGGNKRELTISMTAVAPDAKGAIGMQYKAALTEDGAVLGSAQGKTVLSPGLRKTLPAGENCSISLKAVSF